MEKDKFKIIFFEKESLTSSKNGANFCHRLTRSVINMSNRNNSHIIG